MLVSIRAVLHRFVCLNSWSHQMMLSEEVSLPGGSTSQGEALSLAGPLSVLSASHVLMKYEACSCFHIHPLPLFHLKPRKPLKKKKKIKMFLVKVSIRTTGRKPEEHLAMRYT